MTTLLSLDEFRAFIGYSPWSFWGLTATIGLTRITSTCNEALHKAPWQSVDGLSRDDMEEAIAKAEGLFLSYARYWPAPRYTEKTFQFPRYPDVRLDLTGYAGADGRWQAINLGESYIQKLGVETRTLIDDNSPVAFSDLDNDGLDETFTLTVATTVTDPTQIAVYFSSTERWDLSAVSEKWRVRPISVTISGGTATITGRRWLVVKPVLYEGVAVGDSLDAVDAGNFVTTLDVYRLYIDPTGTTVDTAQEKLIWETQPWPYYCTADPTVNDTDPAAEGYAIGRGSIRDSVLGEVGSARAVYNSTSGVWGSPGWPNAYTRPPDRVMIRYQAGYPAQSDGTMDERMKLALCRLAAAELPKPTCACDTANRVLYHWQFDLSRTDSSEVYQGIAPEDLANPIGARRGQALFWKEIVNTKRVLTGFSVV